MERPVYTNPGYFFRHFKVHQQHQWDVVKRYAKVIHKGMHEAFRVDDRHDFFATHELQYAGNAVTGADRVANEPVVLPMQGIEVDFAVDHDLA